jgi:broad specificity phosphatase PhoE
MHENDRTATGFLPGPEFEATADAFFADPDRSVCGWETARDAQARIVAQVQAALARYAPAHLVFCGHGAVGSLLYCHLAGVPIDRRWDQPGPGHWFAFDIATGTPAGHWRPMETLTAM